MSVSDQVQPAGSRKEGGNDVRRKWIGSGKSRPLIIVVIGLVILAAGVAVAFGVSSRDSDEKALESTVADLQEEVNRLNRDLEALREKAEERDLASQDISDQNDALQQHLKKLEEQYRDLPPRLAEASKRLGELSTSVDMRFNASLEKQEFLESEIEKVRKLRAAATSKSPISKAKKPPAPPSPPFSILGMELRGGRSYLSVISGSSTRLSDIRWVGVGERVGDWYLAAINRDSAQFSVNGQSVVVPVP